MHRLLWLVSGIFFLVEILNTKEQGLNTQDKVQLSKLASEK